MSFSLTLFLLARTHHPDLHSHSVTLTATPTTPVHVPQALRVRAGSWIYLRINVDELTADEIPAGRYLAFKEQLVEGEGLCFRGGE